MKQKIETPFLPSLASVTPAQRRVLAFVVEYQRKAGCPPSYRDIMQGCGFSSPSTVHDHIRRLEKVGVVRVSGTRARSLQLPAILSTEAPAVQIPLVGLITAGEPIEAIDHAEASELISIPRSMVPGSDCYALRVKGESMKDDGILDGDIVIIERNFYPSAGQAVVAILPDGTATLKSWYKEKGRYRLQPRNPLLPPIYTKTLEIRGVVRGVLRIM